MTPWDKRYARGEHLHDEPHPLVTTLVSDLHPGRALDLASGAGRHALWLATCGWRVTAVDSSLVAIQILKQRSEEGGLSIDCMTADLVHHEFVIEREAYDLIIDCNYLQRDLFRSMRAGVTIGGIVIAVIAMIDNDPDVKPMNPKYLLKPGELRAHFEGWELLHCVEGKPPESHRRATAEIVARRSH